MKKNTLIIALLAAFGFFVSTSITSCKTKEGCGLEEKYNSQPDANGEFKRSKTRSNLFSKKKRKKMKKRGEGS
ncbi:MAG: hypothetical protein AAGA77_24430 [Bacteroidota bacterium]